MLRRRSAFTLIELLVVIAIIAVLVGLLLPAVQKVREAANRMKCQNNLKQIGLALHSYHDSQHSFPPSRDSLGNSGHSRLLPYLEQDALYKSINFNARYDDPTNAVPLGTTVNVFLCPSDVNAPIPAGLAGNNYRANEGTSLAFGYGPDETQNASLPPPNGPFFENSKYRMADILDGTSNTAAFSEHILGDFTNAIATEQADTFWPKTYPATPDEAMSMCMAIDWTDLQYQRISTVGAPWLRGYHSTTSYYHSAPPGFRSCMFPPGRIMTTANSRHTGGVNVLLCDGSVRFVSYNVDLLAWRALGTRNGGEVLSEY
jgi:prepilin-type N-terminal cleavage/methylation domain-containing protein/prepilin-type processing-associated H-X9-DG protein